MLDKHGREIPDPTPIAIPAGFKRPETLQEQVARLVRGRLSELASQDGAETFEESEDFDVGDEIDPHSQFEEFFDPAIGQAVTFDELRRNEAVYRERLLKLTKEREEYLDRLQVSKIRPGHRFWPFKRKDAAPEPPHSGGGASGQLPGSTK